MTSFAFILGVVPLVIATGAGAEMRQALGIAVFAGMLGVTVFGLLFTPVFYVVMRKLARSQGSGTGSHEFKCHCRACPGNPGLGCAGPVLGLLTQDRPAHDHLGIPTSACWCRSVIHRPESQGWKWTRSRLWSAPHGFDRRDRSLQMSCASLPCAGSKDLLRGKAKDLLRGKAKDAAFAARPGASLKFTS